MLNFLKKILATIKGMQTSDDRFYLKVTYKEKNAAKALGAKWDAKKKLWYIVKRVSQVDFPNSQPTNRPTIADSNVRANGFFIAVSSEVCWQCNKNTRVFAFILPEDHELKEHDAAEKRFIWTNAGYYSGISFCYFLNDVPLKLMQAFTSNYYLDISKKAGRYYMNHCMYCHSKLSDFYMHAEPDGAFHPTIIQQAEKIKLYWFDHVFSAIIGRASIEVNLFKFMKIISADTAMRPNIKLTK